jgi:predicted PurR-regulated permease PerM
VTGLAQGLLAAVGYAIAGVPEPAFFGAATAVASLIPAVGTLLVWVPTGIFLVATGHAAKGVLELVWGGLVVVGVSDYVIRPALVGRHSAMPALFTFAALFGGVEAFGLIGLILGPLMMALSFSLLRLFAHDAEAQRI